MSPLKSQSMYPSQHRGQQGITILDIALKISNPAIFSTNLGSQVTSTDFTAHVKNAGIRISMDGRGRASDNIFVERL